MAKSEKAKALEAKQKAALKAEKQRKKNSTNPADWGYFRQMRELYKSTSEVDPKLGLFLGLAALGAFAVTILIGVLLKAAGWMWILYVITGLMLAATAAMFVLTQRAKKAAFVRHAGQAGSAEVAMSMLNNKKYQHTAAVAFNRQMDMVHRVVGPCGVVLIGEGKTVGLKQLLVTEQRRHQQVLYGIPVTTITMGDGANQVKLADLQKTIEKLPKAIQPTQQSQIQAKLRSLDAVRPKAPIPKGPMPSMKGMNRAMRGR